MCRLETQSVVTSASNAEWGVGQFGLTEFGGRGVTTSVAEDMTFGLMGVGYQGIKGRSEWGDAQYAQDEWAGILDTGVAPTVVTEYDRYVGFKIEGNQLVSIPEISPKYGITNSQLVPFKDSIYIFSKGEDVMVYDGTTAEPLSSKPNYLPPQDDNGVIAPVIDGDVATAAYGRLWVSGVNDDYSTIYYSDLLVPEQWYDGKGLSLIHI